ncbi:MAG: dephospho-CoA kinase [Bdellovibrionales bacterium]|nr:dephospho-CoA kinase [Massilia sp.]
MTFSVGLTGGIGCGKTTVANLFAELGATLVDTDLIAHDLTSPHGSAMAAIVDQFGPAFATADGALERARMRELVFADPGAKARLEAILHPRIRDAALAQAAAASGAYVIFVVPLLLESGTWRERVTRVVVIDCPEEVQVARVMARNGLSVKQVHAIMATQASRAERLAAADDVITNAGEIGQLRPQIARLHAEYMVFSERMSRLPMQRL